MKNNLYTIFYAMVLGSLCALLLTAAGRFTAPYRERNAKAEKTRNILQVLEIPFEKEISAQDLLTLFKEKVLVEQKNDIDLYITKGKEGEGSEGNAVAISFSGPGLWAPIKGFLALEDDMKTIRGVTFYEHEETPGLGGEISTLSFRDQFKGKKILDSNGNYGIKIRMDFNAQNDNEVDGISGATLTCDKVEAMLNKIISKITSKG